MPLNKSIGMRVFGLALFLLALTIALVGFLLLHVAQLQGEMQELARKDIPLASSLSRLDEFGLRRRLAFERMFGALNLDPPNQVILADAEPDYDQFNQKLQAEFKRAGGILADSGAHPEFSNFRQLLSQVEAAYEPITRRQQEVLALQRQGEHERANTLLDGLDDLQAIVQNERAELQNGTAARAERVAADALSRQAQITYLSIAATASTVMLGLVVAAWVTRGLVLPVRRLIGAMGDVQNGRLDLELPVRSSDEIGALTSSFNFFVQELRAKAQIKETFGKYVDPRVLERVLAAAGPVGGAGERQVMTVEFGDLVGFTGSSERLTPANMVRLLNRHFGLQADAIQAHLGIVDKFIGDAVMAFWGPPFVSAGEHAVLACRAALAQVAAMDVLRAEIHELTGLRRDAPALDLRVGLASGEVIVGNLGAEHTRNFTVIGDTVNIASRIESANRIYGTRILLSDSIARDVARDFELREIDSITVKGRQEQMSIFELLGTAGCLDSGGRSFCDRYAEGLQAYRAGDWPSAMEAFGNCVALKPGDRAAQVMRDRSAAFQAEPPPAPWNGVWNLTEK